MNRYALCGEARIGKDTAADYLIKKGVVEKKYGFSYPLKNMVNALFNWDERHTDGDFKDVDVDVVFSMPEMHNFMFLYQNEYKLHEKYTHINAFTVLGAFMEILDIKYHETPNTKFDGVFAGRFSPRKAYQLFGTEIGRDLISRDIWIDLAPTENVVIVDVRFPNEVEFVKKYNMNTIKIVQYTGLEEHKKVNDHVSESFIDTIECDHIVYNDYTDNFFNELDIVIQGT